MDDKTTPADRPIFVFHEATFFVTDLFLPGFVTAMAAVPVLGLPVSWVLRPEKWPPDLPLVVIWLVAAALLARFVTGPMAATWLRVKRGEKAGLRLGEGDDHVEVTFFVGSRACRVQRFAYADITGCGAEQFQVTPTGGYELRPYVAERGMVRDSVKTPIPLSVLEDSRSLSPAVSHAVAADLDGIIRRHCPLPEPEVPLAVIAQEKQRELLRHTAHLVERLEHERALRARRFLGLDWPQIGLALVATALVVVLWLADLLRLRWDNGTDLFMVGLVFYGFYRLAGAFLRAWRDRPRDAG